MDPLPAVPSLREQTYQRLELAIIDGTLRPGTRLVESELADTLGVSRGPVREAFQMLAKDGFVDIRPRSGAFVHEPTARELEDYFDARQALEQAAVRHAIERGDEADFNRLRTMYEAGADRVRRGLTIPVTKSLHLEIAKISRNALIVDMISLLSRKGQWYSLMLTDEYFIDRYEEHLDIIGAVESRDVRRAKRLVKEHIERSRQNYLRALDQELKSAST